MKCQVCQTNVRDGHCPSFCHVTIPEWLEWNARRGLMVVKKAALLPHLRQYLSLTE
jgi:hypothetical protein